MKPAKRTSPPSKKYPPGSFMYKVRKRRIIETLAAFIGGGWLTWEAVHWILVEHYHFPEKLLDITLVTIIGAMLCTLTWRWFGGIKRKRKVKVELILIPLVILAVALLDVRFIMQMGEHDEEIASETRWKNSIAVLPFANISGDEEQDYFCDGLTEELINRMVNIRDLKVPARTSSFAFKGEKINIKEVGEKLKVEKILEGSVRKTGNRIRVTAQLINIADGYHIWSEQYDREMEDIFRIQDDISLMICDKLKIELLGGVKERVLKRHTENLEAYNLYLQGRLLWNKRTPTDMEKSIEFYEKAIEKDPDFALAYVGIADSYINLFDWAVLPSMTAFPNAKKALYKALELNNSLGEAHCSLAYVFYVFEWNFKSAEKEFNRAIELNPNYATVHQWYGEYLATMGLFEEAYKELDRALELDPLSLIIGAIKGQILFFEGRYEDSIEQLKLTLNINDRFLPSLIYLGWNYIAKGMYQEAIDITQKALSFYEESFPVLQNKIAIHALSGQKEKAKEMFNDLIAETSKIYVPTSGKAVGYSLIGERDKAFEWIERAYDEKHILPNYLKYGLWSDDFRSDPRFKALLNKMNLE